MTIRNGLPVWHATPVLLDAQKAQIVDPREQTRAAPIATTMRGSPRIANTCAGA